MVRKLLQGLLAIIWAVCCLLSCEGRYPVIHLYPVSNMEPEALYCLAEAIEDSLKVKVIKENYFALPDSLWSEIRNRYRAKNVLDYLRGRFPQKPFHKYLLVTNKDLGIAFGPDSLRGANGLSYQSGDFALISDYRLHQYKRSADSVYYYLTKVALHEAGHMYGLTHCKSISCIMESVEVKQHITTLKGFCPQCRKKLRQM